MDSTQGPTPSPPVKAWLENHPTKDQAKILKIGRKDANVTMKVQNQLGIIDKAIHYILKNVFNYHKWIKAASPNTTGSGEKAYVKVDKLAKLLKLTKEESKEMRDLIKKNKDGNFDAFVKNKVKAQLEDINQIDDVLPKEIKELEAQIKIAYDKLEEANEEDKPGFSESFAQLRLEREVLNNRLDHLTKIYGNKRDRVLESCLNSPTFVKESELLLKKFIGKDIPPTTKIDGFIQGTGDLVRKYLNKDKNVDAADIDPMMETCFRALKKYHPEIAKSFKKEVNKIRTDDVKTESLVRISYLEKIKEYAKVVL